MELESAAGSFWCFTLRQGESAAGQWLLLLEAFSLQAAAASGQGSCESEEWDSTSMREGSCLGAVCSAQFQGYLQEGGYLKNAFDLDASFWLCCSRVDSAAPKL